MFGKARSIKFNISVDGVQVPVKVLFSDDFGKTFHTTAQNVMIANGIKNWNAIADENALRRKLLDFCRAIIGFSIKQDFALLSKHYREKVPSLIPGLGKKGIEFLVLIEEGNVAASYIIHSKPDNPLFTLDAREILKQYFLLQTTGKFRIQDLQKLLIHEYTHYFDFASYEFTKARPLKDTAMFHLSQLETLIRNEGIAVIAQSVNSGMVPLNFSELAHASKLLSDAATSEVKKNETHLLGRNRAYYEAGRIYAAACLLAISDSWETAKLTHDSNQGNVRQLGEFAKKHPQRVELLLPVSAFSHVSELRNMNAEEFLDYSWRVLTSLGVKEPIYNLPLQIQTIRAGLGKKAA